jgi:hypothetical protein
MIRTLARGLALGKTNVAVHPGSTFFGFRFDISRLIRAGPIGKQARVDWSLP